MNKKQKYQQKLLERRENVLMMVQVELDIFFSKEKSDKLLKLGNTKFYQEINKIKERFKK